MAKPAARPRGLVTAQELLEKYTTSDGKQELRQGRLVAMEPPGGWHGRAATRLATRLDLHVTRRAAGGAVFVETGYVLATNPDTVRSPDVSFVSRERLPPDEALSGYIPHAPDLAAEVLSPNDRWAEIEEKVAEYFAAGTRLVWLADPARRHVIVKTPNGRSRTVPAEGTLDGSDVLPGFSVRVGDLF